MSVLTILIPNYNRLNQLIRLLDSIFDQVDREKLEAFIEIVVVDDFSNEKIERSLCVYQNRKNFHFYMQDQRCGNAEVAFFSSLKHVVTDYVWLFGNDDLILPGALYAVLKIIKSYLPGFVLLNPLLKKDKHSLAPIKTLFSICYYEGSDQLFMDFGFMTSTTTFSCLIAKTERLKNFVLNTKFAEISKVYSHTFAFHAAFRNEVCLFVAKPLISFTMSDAGEEQIKIQSQAPSNVMYASQTIGITRLIFASSRITGLPVSWYGKVTENEINKEDLNVYTNSLSEITLRFFIDQLIRERISIAQRRRGFIYFTKSEILEITKLIEQFEDSYILDIFRESLNIYVKENLSPDLIVAKLSSLKSEIHESGIHRYENDKLFTPNEYKSLSLSYKGFFFSLLSGL